MPNMQPNGELRDAIRLEMESMLSFPPIGALDCIKFEIVDELRKTILDKALAEAFSQAIPKNLIQNLFALMNDHIRRTVKEEMQDIKTNLEAITQSLRNDLNDEYWWKHGEDDPPSDE
jgi:hypothetical protein